MALAVGVVVACLSPPASGDQLTIVDVIQLEIEDCSGISCIGDQLDNDRDNAQRGGGDGAAWPVLSSLFGCGGGDGGGGDDDNDAARRGTRRRRPPRSVGGAPTDDDNDFMRPPPRSPRA